MSKNSAIVSTEGCLKSGSVAAAHYQWLGDLAQMNAVGSIEPTLESLDLIHIDDRRTMTAISKESTNGTLKRVSGTLQCARI